MDIEKIMLTDGDCATEASIATRLNDLQRMGGDNWKVVGWSLMISNSAPVTWVQHCLYHAPTKRTNWGKIEANVFPMGATAAVDAQKHLLKNNRHAICFGEARVGGNPCMLLLSRAGLTAVWQGKMSKFGGPNDKGMKAAEGVAIVTDKDLADNQDGIKSFFADGATKALGHNLKSDDTYFIACRWNYNITPRTYLLATDVTVRNPVTGLSIKARPVDWGPNEDTGRIADFSNKLAKDLGLETDQICEVTVPLPDAAGAIILAGTGLAKKITEIAQAEYDRYHGKHEDFDPMLSRIKQYYSDMGWPYKDEAWSGVFICWCLKKAGVTNADFSFSKGHWKYVNAAITRALATPQGSYPALKIEDYAPQPGDIIHANRDRAGKTYEMAAEADLDAESYPSHCVIVVGIVTEKDEVSGKVVPKMAITIGGNESQSVGRRELPLHEDGKLIQTTRDPYICVIKMS